MRASAAASRSGTDRTAPSVSLCRNSAPLCRNRSHGHWYTDRGPAESTPLAQPRERKMRLRYKVAYGALLIVAIALLAGFLALSYESPCGAGPTLLAGTPTMKAAVHRCYGSSDVIRVADVAKPSPADNE